LFINLGGRWDNYSTYGSHTTYQLGGAYLVPGLETKIKATYGTGFLAPTLYQLYAPSPTGNASLQPETSTGYDYGFEQPIGQKFFVFGVTGFHNEFDDPINYVGSQYINSADFLQWN
jgi:vitamin B12 transporter